MRAVLKHIAIETLAFLFGPMRFFNGVMGMVSLGQAIRLWAPDVAFDIAGYSGLKHLISENWFAVLPFMHFVGVTFRIYTEKFFVGRNWFWRVGQVTHTIGAISFAVPAVAITSDLHTAGVQSVGMLIISAAMLWQVFRTDT